MSAIDLDATFKPPRARRWVGELMVARGFVTEQELARALARHAVCGLPLGEVLRSLGFATEREVLIALAEQCALPWVELDARSPARALAALVPEALARRCGVVPLSLEDRILVVAIRAPALRHHLERVSAASGKPVRAVIASDRALRTAIEALYGPA